MSKESTQVSVAVQQLPETTMPAIEMIDLCKSFGTFKAVDHLSLTVRQGEIFGLLGPNGSGKTTTINLISGLMGSTSGEGRVLGLNVWRQAAQVAQILWSVS